MVILPSIRRKYMVNRIPKGATVPMSDCVVTLAETSKSYTGTARTVGVTVTWDGATLAVNTDYTLAYANNVNLGPATVTVTGKGQFAGSVTRTFYIVVGSDAAWDFDITDASRVDNKYLGDTNGGAMRQFAQNMGGGLVVGAFSASGAWMKGWSVPRDGGGEFHISNIDASDHTVLDGSGLDNNYYMFLGISNDGTRSYWGPNGSSMVIRQKGGTAFDFSNMTDGGSSPDLGTSSIQTTGPMYTSGIFFAGNGAYVFVPQSGFKLHRYAMSTPWDVSTIDLSSGVEMSFLGYTGANTIRALAFDPSGTVALVSVSDRKYLYQVHLPAAYDFTDATLVGTLDMSADSGYYSFRGLAVVNDAATLLACTQNGIAEFSLS